MMWGPFRVILNEGGIVFNAETNSYSFKSEIKLNDMVEPDNDPANTYVLCNGMVVVKHNSTKKDLAVGKIVSDPVPVELPTHSTDDWKYCLEHGWYRCAILDTTMLQHPEEMF